MDTKKLRINYHNEWPNKFYFPAELKFIKKMKDSGLSQGLMPIPLQYSDEYKFQFYLGYLIDALDMLPMRPDLAFEHIWKALDSEFFLIQTEIGNNTSRFDSFVDKVLNDPNTAGTFIDYLQYIPHQTCEYAAKRIIQATTTTDNYSTVLLTRAKQSLGEQFIVDFVTKYPANTNGKPSSSDQRKAGRLLKKVFLGEKIILNGNEYEILEEDLAKFMVKVVLANSRNERFHGNTFPPFRSSFAKLSTYAHAYFFLHLSYALLLEVFLYREYNVISSQKVKDGITHNVTLFKLLFEGIE